MRKILKKKMGNKKTLAKKSMKFFSCPVLDINISDIFIKIQKFLRASSASIIKTNGINMLIAGPLKTTTPSWLKCFKYFGRRSSTNKVMNLNAVCRTGTITTMQLKIEVGLTFTYSSKHNIKTRIQCITVDQRYENTK